MMTFFSSLYVGIGMKSLVEKLIALYLIRLALLHKENVAAKIGHGTFEIVATGKPPRKLP